MDSLSTTNQNNIRNWFRQMFGNEKHIPNSLSWIYKDRKELERIITTKYTNVNTRKTHFITLAKVMKTLKKTKEYEKFSKISTELNLENEKLLENQHLTEKQKKVWMTFEQIQALAEALQDRMFSGSQIDMYRGLIASLYIFYPPVRLDYSNVIVWKKGKTIPKDDKNYIVEKKGIFTMYLRKYKMAWKYGNQEVCFGKELSLVIHESLEEFPRKYLLSLATDPDMPLGDGNLGKALTKIFGFSVQILRKIYLSHFWNVWNGNLAKTTKLAKMMLHDRTTAEKYYRKFVSGDVGYNSDDDDDTVGVVSRESIPAPPTPSPTPEKDVIGKNGFTYAEYTKKYREEHKPDRKKEGERRYAKKKDEILRSKLVSNLNRNLVKAPMAQSITKYNLVKTGDVWS